MIYADDPIGVFDSGLGGLSVLKKLMDIMPQENFVYLGDSGNAPYGIKSTDEVRALTVSNIKYLLSMDCKAICIACNTATSAAITELRAIYPDLPLVGIEPAIKPACQNNKNPRVLVMATPMTIREKKFQSLLAKYEHGAEIIQLPCPGLMEFIENGTLEGKEIDSFLEELLGDYADKNISSVVLGCTHYPFVGGKISSILGNVKLYDGCEGTASELKRRIKNADLLNPDIGTYGSVNLINSDQNKLPLAEKLLDSLM